MNKKELKTELEMANRAINEWKRQYNALHWENERLRKAATSRRHNIEYYTGQLKTLKAENEELRKTMRERE